MTTGPAADRSPDWFTEWDRRTLLHLDQRTIATLREADAFIRENASAMADAFYARLREVPSAVEFIGEHSTFERLHSTLVDYICAFTTSDFDEEHVDRARRIAERHDLIKLPIDAYQAQLQVIREAWLEVLLEVDRKGRTVRPAAEIARLFSALDRALTFDEGTVSLCYTDALRTALDQLVAQEARLGVQRRLHELAEELAETAERSSGSVQQMSASTEQVANEVTGATHQANQATDIARSGIASLEAAEGAVAGVREAAGRLGDSASDLEEASARIERISEVLRRTAEQIKVLALNAAIEASRAGEAGRGFGIVAEEVRRLAESTQHNLVEANDAIDGMKRTIAAVRAAGETTEGQVDELVGATGALDTTFQEIVHAVESTSRGLETIAAASQEVASTAGSTGRGSIGLARLAEEVKSVADQLAG